MKRLLLATFTALAMLATLSTTRVEAAEAPSTEPLDPREILASAVHAGGPAPSGWTDRRSMVEIEAHAGGDVVRSRRAEVLERARASDDDEEGRLELSTLIELLDPADVQGTRVLEFWEPGDEVDAWTWSPATRRARRMAPDEGDESPWYNVEPSYRDAQLLDVLPRLAREAKTVKVTGEEKIDDADATILEIELAQAEALPSNRYRVWIASADRLVRRIDALDEAGDPRRRIAATAVETIDGRATATALEVSTPGTERRTVFRRSGVRYDTEIPTRTWSLANLSKGR